MSGANNLRSPAQRAARWHQTRRLTAQLLAAWLGVTLLTIFFARELADITLWGWSISFFMAAQGSSLIFLLIVGVYAWRMHHIDRIAEHETPHGD